MNTLLRHASCFGEHGMRPGSLGICGGFFRDDLAGPTLEIDLPGHRIFPGLINAHDHLHLNALPHYEGHGRFANSYAWIEAYQPQFQEPSVAAALALPKALRLRHGALKNLLSGVTCVAHHDPWHAALDAADFPVALLRHAGWCYAPGWPDYGPPMRESFLDTPAQRPWLIHLGEGTDARAQAELGELDALGCLAPNTVIVHGVGLDTHDVANLIERGAAAVWCPSSNLNLLGRTLDPSRFHAAGCLALGTDSRLTGARDVLEEIAVARACSDLSAQDLVAMVTAHAARILRLEGRGHLRAGAHADVIVTLDDGSDGLDDISRGDLRAVVRDGRPVLADPDFAEWFEALGVDVVSISLDGRPKLLAADLADPDLIALEPGLTWPGGPLTSASPPSREIPCS